MVKPEVKPDPDRGPKDITEPVTVECVDQPCDLSEEEQAQSRSSPRFERSGGTETATPGDGEYSTIHSISYITRSTRAP